MGLIVLALALILGTVAATGWAAQQSGAAIVRAQGQASIDRAEATVQQIEALAVAVGLLSAAPLVVMLLIAALGLGLMAVAITGLRSRPTAG